MMTDSIGLGCWSAYHLYLRNLKGISALTGPIHMRLKVCARYEGGLVLGELSVSVRLAVLGAAWDPSWHETSILVSYAL